jgi:hypothetical protein
LWTSINGHEFVSDPAIRAFLPIGVVAGFALMVAGLAVGASIFLFNRPSFLVAPDLRSDNGALTDLRTSPDSRRS